MSVLTLREEKIKEREGNRLLRFLRRLFGTKKFGFHWTNEDTSYTDGKDIYVKYDIQIPQCRTFTDVELRILRRAHAVHERGHIEFDYLPAYLNWQKEKSSNDKMDWKANKKYPLKWCQHFGNMSLDGRMERLTCIKYPSQEEYIEFCNYEWRFGIRGENAGESRLNDFMECFSSRVLGMTDLEDWHEDAVALADELSTLIELIRQASSTKSCLELVSLLLEDVWPTLYEWLELKDLDPNDGLGEGFIDDHANSKWSEDEDTANHNSKEALIIAKEPNSEDEKENSTGKPKTAKPDFSSITDKEQKVMVEEEKAIDKEIELDSTKKDEVTFKSLSGIPMSNNVQVGPLPYSNPDQYNKTHSQIKRLIKPTARALKQLVEGTPDQVRKNTRSGRFNPSKAWRAVHCDDSNVFNKTQKGDNAANVWLSFMTDISGSTYSQLNNGKTIIDEQRAALALMLEATHEAKIASTAYAFTEEHDTLIYRLKDDDSVFNAKNRAAVGGIQPLLGNRDTLALRWILDQAEKRTEEIRIVVMLSDGIPMFERDEGSKTMRNMVEEAQRNGIEVLCLFVGEHRKDTIEAVQSMYPGRLISANKGIAKELQKHVKRIIRRRK
jgi:hypothetical protein